MKVKCRTEVVDETPRRNTKRKMGEEIEAGPSEKRRKTVDGSRTWGPENEGQNERLERAVQEWGEKVADVINGVGDRISDLSRSLQESTVTQKGILGQLQRMVWVEDRMRTSLHLINRHLESMVETDGGPVIGIVGDRKEDQEMIGKDKGKEKGVNSAGKVAKSEKSEKLEESEGSEVEDVVKGPEISTLDVDESMEVEK